MPTDRDSDDTDHHFTQHLDYQDYTTPISFRVTYEGEDTLLPAVEIGRILDHEFDLVRGQTFGRVAKRSRLCRWYSQLRGHS
jgi:hypothetical protein